MAEISVITQDTAEPCLDLAACVFAARSTLHQVAGIDADVYRDRLYPAFMHNIAQGLSVAAWENGEVLGALIACDIRDQGAVIPDPRLRAMHALMHEMEERYLADREPSVGEVVLVDMAFVDPRAAGKGIYTQLRKSAQTVALDHGFKRVVGLLSSSATQKVVVDKLGHACLYRQRFGTFQFEGLKPFANIVDPEEIWLTEGHLQ